MTNSGAARGLRTWQLFAVCVGVWGTTWHVITWQLGATESELGKGATFVVQFPTTPV